MLDAGLPQAAADEVDFHVIVDSLPHIVWISDADGLIEYLNRLGSDYLGAPVVAGRAVDWPTLIHPDDAGGAASVFARRMSGRAGRRALRCDCVAPMVHTDGTRSGSTRAETALRSW